MKKIQITRESLNSAADAFRKELERETPRAIEFCQTALHSHTERAAWKDRQRRGR